MNWKTTTWVDRDNRTHSQIVDNGRIVGHQVSDDFDPNIPPAGHRYALLTFRGDRGDTYEGMWQGTITIDTGKYGRVTIVCVQGIWHLITEKGVFLADRSHGQYGPVEWHYTPLAPLVVLRLVETPEVSVKDEIRNRFPSTVKKPEPKEFPPIRQRHLLYHIYPVTGDVWRKGVQALKDRWNLFTGRKIVCVLTEDPKKGKTQRVLDTPDEVISLLPPDAEVFIQPNNTALREVATWEPLWSRVLSTAHDDDAVLYAHAKGVTRPHDEAVQLWSDTLYPLHLDYWPVVEKLLRTHALAGTFLKFGYPLAWARIRAPWHYSSSWFWSRVGEIRRVGIDGVPQQWWGVEPWPSLKFHADEAGVIFCEGVCEKLELYEKWVWKTTVTPELQKWTQENIGNRSVIGS